MFRDSMGVISRVGATPSTSGIYPVERISGKSSRVNTNRTGRTTKRTSFAQAMEKAVQNGNYPTNTASALKGDMVITQSSYYRANGYAQTADKPKENMTMEEYKQWFQNKVLSIQSGLYSGSGYISDTVVIKEDAFEKMKGDADYEQSVINQIKAHYSTGHTAGSKEIGYQVIGVSPEETYENRIPVNVSSAYLTNNLLAQSGYANNQANQSWLQGYLLQSLISGQGAYGLSSYLPSSLGVLSAYPSGLGLLGYSSTGTSGLASSAYKNVMNNFLTNSLLGSQLI